MASMIHDVFTRLRQHITTITELLHTEKDQTPLICEVAAIGVMQRGDSLPETDHEQTGPTISLLQCVGLENLTVGVDGCDSTAPVVDPAPEAATNNLFARQSTVIGDLQPHQQAVENLPSQRSLPVTSREASIGPHPALPHVQITSDCTVKKSLDITIEQQHIEVNTTSDDESRDESDIQTSNRLTADVRRPRTITPPHESVLCNPTENEYRSASHPHNTAQTIDSEIQLHRTSSLRRRHNNLQVVQTPTRQAAQKRPSEQNIESLRKKRAKATPAIIEPTEVYLKLASRSNSSEQNLLWLMTRLFCEIASPEALDQLRHACMLLREKGEFTQIINALEEIQVAREKQEVKDREKDVVALRKKQVKIAKRVQKAEQARLVLQRKREREIARLSRERGKLEKQQEREDAKEDKLAEKQLQEEAKQAKKALRKKPERDNAKKSLVVVLKVRWEPWHEILE